ncbi:MAG: hypothetical protein JKY88_01545 [Pseudomonadales bacterium]|nr:hypothetical protein [Pseudomonadales bacterium]
MRISQLLHILCLFCLQTSAAFAVQASPNSIIVTEVESADIVVDGVLDEAIWASLPMKDDMVIVEPDTLDKPPYETRSHLFYTKKGLYLGVWAEQPVDTLVSRLSSRDRFIKRDSITITIDPSGRGLYGYWFSVNLGGTLQDGTLLPERQYASQWDGPWYGASAEHDNGWTAEFFIPWSIMTMPEGETDYREMSYYLARSVAHKNESWGFPSLPRTNTVFISKFQKISFENVNPKQQFTFYPYASSSYDNTLDNGADAYKAGFDIFWRPTSNLQISATINPDFGNVESDNVVVNLSSFETFFPEKRAFFLEGQEVFVTSARARQRRNGRGTPTTLLNTRRIGSAPKATLVNDFQLTGIEANQPSELIGATKITGQYGNMRYGVLAAFEEDTKLTGTVNDIAFSTVQDGREFGVARFIYEDTSTGARRSLGWMTTTVRHPQENAIVHGIDGHYLSADGKWNTDAQFMYSKVGDISGQGGFFDVTYSAQQGRTHRFSFDYFDDALDINDLGFLRRNDTVGLVYSYNKNESGLKNLKRKSTGMRVVQKYNTNGKLVRSGLFFNQERSFNNNTFMFSQINYFPSRWEDRDSLDNGDYRIEGRWQAEVFAETDQSKKFSVGGAIEYQGEDIGGQMMNYFVNLVWRPVDRFSFAMRLNYQDRQGWLLHHNNRNFTTFDAEIWRPNISLDFFLSAKQEFRITAQWAGFKANESERWEVPLNEGSLDPVTRLAGDADRDFNISRLTFQARYRWELAPLSDLFVVYTRGSNVATMPNDSFGDLLRGSWTDALVDIFVIKLRYRIGG